MSHLSDKDIDHLAREAAEQLDVDQNSSGWEALQARLDVEMPVEKRRRRWLFLLLFPLLGGGFFVVHKWNQSAQPTSRNQQPKTVQRSTLDQKVKTGEAVTEKTNDAELSNTSSTTDESVTNKETDLGQNKEKPAGSTAQGTAATDNSGGDFAITRPKEQAVFNGGNVPTGKSKGKKINGNKQAMAKSPTTAVIVSQSGTKAPASNSGNVITANEGPSDTDASAAKPDLTTATTEDSSSTTRAVDTKIDSSVTSSRAVSKDSTAVTTSSNKPAKKKTGNTLMPYKGFVLGLVAGPDVSKVNGTSTDERGFNYGLVAGYRFNGRLSLLSGVGYTHKYYTAKGADYNPPKGTWLDTVSLSKVVGDCFMYEIPVNVRYDVLASRKNYAFASAGLSSYFMTKENYDFHYTTNTGYYSQYRSYKTSDQYWFSVLNLSAGYERMVSKRLSLQVEPYLKLPLNGIGFGKMDLSSYGVFFGVRYHAGMLKAR